MLARQSSTLPEGGEDGVLLYPYQIQIGTDCWCRSRALATKAV